MRRTVLLSGVLAVVLALSGCVGDTDPATEITATSAKLNAHGRTNDGPARWWWEYDTVRAELGTASDTERCGSGTRCGPASAPSDVALSQVVTGLAPDTTYFFRACGQDVNDTGPACARILSFRTLTAAPAAPVLAFVRGVPGEDEELHVLAGGQVTRVTNNAVPDIGPALSPDGRRLAFTRLQGERHQLFVANRDGTGETQLTSGTASAFTPAWSPDGARIAFERNLPGRGPRLAVIGAAGGTPQELAEGGSYPSWSPDGRSIAFNGFGIQAIGADGTGLRTLRDTTAPNDFGGSPDWSPDGSRIAFSARVAATDSFELWVMDASGANPRRLTSTANRSEEDPSWSPDGGRLAYGLDAREVWTVNADGSGAARAMTLSSVRDPDWGR